MKLTTILKANVRMLISTSLVSTEPATLDTGYIAIVTILSIGVVVICVVTAAYIYYHNDQIKKVPTIFGPH